MPARVTLREKAIILAVEAALTKVEQQIGMLDSRVKAHATEEGILMGMSLIKAVRTIRRRRKAKRWVRVE